MNWNYDLKNMPRGETVLVLTRSGLIREARCTPDTRVRKSSVGTPVIDCAGYRGPSYKSTLAAVAWQPNSANQSRSKTSSPTSSPARRVVRGRSGGFLHILPVWSVKKSVKKFSNIIIYISYILPFFPSIELGTRHRPSPSIQRSAFMLVQHVRHGEKTLYIK